MISGDSRTSDIPRRVSSRVRQNRKCDLDKMMSLIAVMAVVEPSRETATPQVSLIAVIAVVEIEYQLEAGLNHRCLWDTQR